MRRTIIMTVLAAAVSALSLSSKAGAGESYMNPEKNYGFKFSGFFKTDISYDDAEIYPGDFHLFVKDYGEEDDALYLTTRETRLGFDFFWKDNGIKTAAKLEFDFYGAGADAVNKAAPMLRHAYVKIVGKRWALLAGQTWDVISPLVPKTVNYSVAWAQGNIGYRRPQVRFSTWAGAGGGAKLTLDAAIARNIGADYRVYENGWNPEAGGDGVDDGADSATPVVQGRLGMSSNFSDQGMLALGVSGHYGEEEYRLFDTAGNETGEKSLSSWSFNTDLTLRINKYACLKGEFFMGENLATYLGGVLQKADNLYDPLRSMGGWGMLSLSPTEKLTVNGGYSFDDPDEEEYSVAAPAGGSTSVTSTFKSLNSLAFGNIMYDFTGNLTGMLEFSYLTTEYAAKTRTAAGTATATEEFDDLRIQLAIKASIK